MAVGRLFKTGRCQKKDFFDLIINELKSAGWTDISSNSTTDFWVMVSEGTSGNKQLVMQFRDFSTGTQIANSCRTTNNSSASVRFPLEYVPGAGGTSGTFARPATTYQTIYCYNTAIDMNMMLEYAISANKDNIVIILIPPIATLIGSFTYFIGFPDEAYTEEQKSDGCIFAGSYSSGIITANTVVVANNTSEQYINSTDSTTRSVKSNMTIKNPNSAGLYVLTDMTYENASEGTRGKINSILFLPDMNILSNDIIMDGSHKYRVSRNHPVTAGILNSFPSAAIAYRIE